MKQKKKIVKPKSTIPEKQTTARSSFAKPSFLYKKYIQVSIIAAITFICYFNTVFSDYSLDDDFITDNEHLSKGFSEFKYIWTHAYAETGGFEVDYRPLSLSLFSLEFMVFGKHAAVSHAISVFLYIACMILLYLVCTSVFKLDKLHPLIPLLVIILYSIHPSHAEIVASIKNRDELLSFIFILLAVLFFNKSFEAEKPAKAYLFVLVTSIFFYASMLTKLVGIPFMACLFLWSLYSGQYKKYKILGALVTVFVILITCHYLMFSEWLGRHVSFNENPIEPGTDIAMRLGVSFNALLFYLKFLLVPYPGRYYYGFNTIPFESIANPLPLLSLLIYILLTGLFIYSVMRRKNYSYFLGAFLFVIFFYSNIFIPYTGIVSERAMFHFGFFFIIFFVLIIYNLFFSTNKGAVNNIYSKTFAVLFCITVFIYAGLTIARNRQWRNPETLITHDIKYMQASAFGNYLAGTNFYHKGINLQPSDTVNKRAWMELSLYYLNQSVALSIKGPRSLTWYNLGMVYRYGFSDLQNAEKNFLIYEKLQPDYKGLAREIASVYFLENKFQEAAPYYEKAVKEEPDDAQLLFYRALNLFNFKDIDHFLPVNEQLLKKFPKTYYPYLNYGSYYLYMHDQVKTLQYLELAVKYGCLNPDVLNYLAKYYRDKNEPAKADFYERLKMKSSIAG